MREQSIYIVVIYHYIRGVIAQGDIKVCKISTHDNHLDMMTKSVSTTEVDLCSNLISVAI